MSRFQVEEESPSTRDHLSRYKQNPLSRYYGVPRSGNVVLCCFYIILWKRLLCILFVNELEIQNFPLSSCSSLTNPGGEANQDIIKTVQKHIKQITL
ncbi:hypothetical protein CsSME_00021794 [Camellia sinensis var. sinensis]